MKKFLFLVWIFTALKGKTQERISVDVCVYGGTSGGVIAAYTAAKLGKKVLLVNPAAQVGGLSSGGLGNTDIGNKIAITGLAKDFYHRVGMHYGKTEQWIFEPHVAGHIFQQLIVESGFRLLNNQILKKVLLKGKLIQRIETRSSVRGEQNGYLVDAREFIDCSYEGDLMAGAGVSFTVGRESNQQYQENYNGVQMLDKHQFPDDVDPYIIPGKPESGLLWGIRNGEPEIRGSGDRKVQAYNFRLCLTDSPENRIAISKPENYNSSHYELLLRYIQVKKPASLEEGILNINKIPGRKTDINNNGPFSTDMIGMNYQYAEGNEETRKKIIRAHQEYTMGLLYFLGHDSRVPEYLRTEMLTWGYPKDEYINNNHWTPQLYIRESRRMVSEYVMTEANCIGKAIISDSIGLAAYTMDSHNCDRLVFRGMVKNEGDVQIGGFPPYPVSYRSIVPKQTECTNLLVPVCLSASHIAYGSIRMEPVFMVLSQSAAMAAVMAMDLKVPVQKIPVKKLQEAIRENPLAQKPL